MKIARDISSKVLVTGPDPDCKGGISSVIKTQGEMMECFNLIKTTGSGWHKYLYLFTSIFKSLKALSSKYKITHIHSASFKDFYRNIPLIYLHKLLGKKVIIHLHGGKFDQFYVKKTGLVSRVCNKADLVLTVSNYFKAFALSNGLNSNVECLHNSIKDIDHSNNRVEHPGIVLSYFGAIDNHKGIFDVVHALGKYGQGFGDYRLIIGGSGDVQYLKSIIAKYGLENNVEYAGWLDSSGKDELLRKTDIFIQPSHIESFGISILEAMNYGLPIVTTNIGGIPDLVTDSVNGIVVAPGNETEIAQAIKKLIDDPALRTKLGANSASHAKDFYYSVILGRLQNIYKSLL